MSKAYKFPEQVKFILMALLSVTKSDFKHIFGLEFSRTGMAFFKYFSRTGQKILGRPRGSLLAIMGLEKCYMKSSVNPIRPPPVFPPPS